MNWQVPLFDVSYGLEEQRAVQEVIASGWLTCGSRTQDFESAFCDQIGAPFGVAVSNCTAALHLALISIDVQPGDEVICPSMTFVATASSVMAVGAQPVFADIESLDWPMVSAASLEKKITERTRAIIVVHYAGYLCDMPSIIELARRFDLKVIEDCAHAPGAKLADTCAGTWGDVGCFSFYSNKNLSVGEGGMLVTADSAVAHRARLLRSHGLSADTMERHRGTKTSYDVLEIGYNYRPTEIASALGLTQLPKLNEKNAERAELVAQYKQLIKGLGLNVDIPFADHVDGAVHHILPVLLPKQLDREQVMQGLRSKGVQSSIHYPPVHRLSAFSHLKPDRLAATELFGDREITLPLYPTMGGQKVRYVVESLAGCM